MKKVLFALAIVSILIVSGCSSNKLNQSGGTSQNKQQIETQKDIPAAEREKHKKIEVKVEGENELRDASLTLSDSLGYSFYLLDNFDFSAEEPGKDIIFSKLDGEFFVRIEKLDSKVNLQEYKKAQKSGYQSMGTVNNIEPSTLFAENFKDANYCFIVNIPKSENVKTQTSIINVVKDFNGNLYSFTFHMPLKEAAEGITPSLWAMVSTVEAN